MRPRTSLAALAAILAALAIAASGARADAWDDALAGAGLTRETARFNERDFNLSGEGEFRLPLFDALIFDPLSGPFHTRTLRASLLASSGSAGDLVMAGAARIGAGTRLTLLGDPMAPYAEEAKKPGALRTALDGVWKAAGRTPSARERARLDRELPRLPAGVAEQAALLLNVEMQALRWRERALAPVRRAGLTPDEAFEVAAGRAPMDEDGFPRAQALMRSVDLKRLMVGAELTAMAADRAATALAKLNATEGYAFRAWTPFGWVILNGAGDDAIDRVQPNLLVIDTGGNDLYRSGGATHGAQYPVSVLVDVSGDDRYVNNPGLDATPVMRFSGRREPAPPSFGTGFLGYGVLVDAAGDDLYRAVGPTMGRADYGLGMLHDLSLIHI